MLPLLPNVVLLWKIISMNVVLLFQLATARTFQSQYLVPQQ